MTQAGGFAPLFSATSHHLNPSHHLTGSAQLCAGTVGLLRPQGTAQTSGCFPGGSHTCRDLPGPCAFETQECGAFRSTGSPVGTAADAGSLPLPILPGDSCEAAFHKNVLQDRAPADKDGIPPALLPQFCSLGPQVPTNHLLASLKLCFRTEPRLRHWLSAGGI